MPALATIDEVRDILVAAAAARSPVTYGELLGHLGFAFSRPKMRALCVILAALDRRCAADCEAELAVLVVRQSDGLPGQGWWAGGNARDRGYKGEWTGPAARRFIGRIQAQSFDFWQSRCGTKGRTPSS